MSESANDMPSTSVAQATLPLLPTKERPKREHNLKVKGKLKDAIDFIVFEGLPLDEAAKRSGLTTYTLRQAFARPHVIAHLKARRQVLRESVNGSNILRLQQIRDAADNMPAIQAIRTLEQMDETERANGSASGASASPGVTIRIVNVVQAGHVNAGQPVMIDAEPTLLPISVDAEGGGEK